MAPNWVPPGVLTITDKDCNEVLNTKAGDKGTVTVELPEYSFREGKTVIYSPYTVSCGGESRKVYLKGNTTISFER